MCDNLFVGSEVLDMFKESVLWFVVSTVILPLLQVGVPWFRAQSKKNIVLPMKDEKIKDVGIMYGVMLWEIYRVFLPVLSILGITYPFIFLVDTLTLVPDSGNVIALGCLFVLILSSIVVKKIEANAFKKAYTIVVILLIDIFTLLMLITFARTKTVAHIVIMMLILFTYLGIGYKTRNTQLIKKYKSVNILKTIRVILSLLFLGFGLANLVVDMWAIFVDIFYLYFILWLIFCFVEWTIIERKDTEVFVKYKIVLAEDIVYTRKKVRQHNADKVEIVLEDGTIRIVEGKDIQYIEFTLKNNSIKKSGHKVICTLYDESVKEYDKFRYVNDNWVRLYENCDEGCIVTTLNDAKIKEIKG